MAESKSIGQLQKDAEQFFKDKKYDKCIEVCTKIISRDDATEADKASAYFNRGKAKDRQGKYEEAIADYDKAIKLYHFFVPYKTPYTLADYDKVIKLYPKYVNAYINRGNTKDRQGKYEEAIKDYDKAIELDPQNAIAYSNRGLMEDRQRRYRKAIAYYTTAIEKDPKYVNAYINRGITKRKRKKYKEAIADYTTAIELDPKYVNAYINRGNAKYSQGKYEEAIKDYNKAIKLDEQNETAYNNRGNAKYSQKNYKEAIKDYDKAIDLDSKYTTAYINGGNAQYRQEDYKKAEDYYTRAINTNKKNATLYNSRGNAKYKQKNYKKAIKEYDKAIKKNPKYVEAYYNKGYTNFMLGNYEEAIKDYDEAIGIDGKKAEAHYYKGTANFMLGNYEEAIDDYDKAKKCKEDFASAKADYSILKYLLYTKSDDSKVSKVSKFIENLNKALRIGIAEKYKESNISDNKKYCNKKYIFCIFQNVVKILDELKVKVNKKSNKEEYLSHTTRLSVLKQLLPIPPTQKEDLSSQSVASIFRLYHIVYSNDPTEGKILFKKLSIDDETEIPFYVMIASFSKGVISGDDFSELDTIPIWHMYGDDAKGISLLFKTTDIASDETRHIGNPVQNLNILEQDHTQDIDGSEVKRVLENIHQIQNIDDNPLLKPILYKVHYTDVKKPLKDSDKGKIVGYLRDIQNRLKEIEKKEDEKIYKKTLELLSGLRYLIKDKRYEYENEYRLVCFLTLDSIQYDEKDPENDAINRMYVEEDIIAKLDSIIVGAKVPPAKVLEIKYLLRKCDKTKDRKIKVIPSSIPYR